MQFAYLDGTQIEVEHYHAEYSLPEGEGQTQNDISLMWNRLKYRGITDVQRQQNQRTSVQN